MKKLNLSFIALFAIVALLFTACEEDIIDPDLGGGDGTPPSISLVDEAGFISADGDIDLGLPLKFKVSVSKGSADLRTITVLEDGSELPLERISLSANPILFVANKGDQTLEIEITPADKAERYTYTFEVEDEDGEIDAVSAVLNLVNPLTPLDQSITGALLNQGGPAGTGGLDLDEGVGTASDSEEAEIQDEGIDLSLSATDNWRQQISSVNDAEVLYVDDLAKALGVESITFEDIQYQEQIADAFAAGTELDGEDCVCDDKEGAGEKVSQPLVVGDIFAVRRKLIDSEEIRTYLIECTAVNITPDDGDNNDNYEFSIKY